MNLTTLQLLLVAAAAASPSASVPSADAFAPSTHRHHRCLRPAVPSVAPSASASARRCGGPRAARLEARRSNRLAPLRSRREGTNSDGDDSISRILSVRGGGGDEGDGAAFLCHAQSAIARARTFASKNFFLLGMVVAVSFARLLPELGRNGSVLRPELFIGKYGVTTIFLLSGISLKMSELTNAASNLALNGLIQAVTFAAWPFLVGAPLIQAIRALAPNLLPPALLEGVLILACLPTTINMCILLTSASGGSVATALCNTVISNMAGIFLTPALLLRFFGKSIELPFLDLVMKLCGKVLLPVAVGQAMRATPVKDFYSKNTGFFKRLQELVLLGIVWNAFCNAFTRGLGMDMSHAIVLLILLPLLHVGSLFATFTLFRSKLPLLRSTTRGEAVAATFCGAHKTLAFGLPLINTVFEGNPNLASYCAPIMLMHPLQLVIGSLAVPYFTRFTEGDGDGDKAE